MSPNSKTKSFMKTNKYIQTSCSTFCILGIDNSSFQIASRTRSKTQETFLGSKNLSEKKERVRWMRKYFLWTWWDDRDYDYNYLRIKPECFEHLFHLFTPRVTYGWHTSTYEWRMIYKYIQETYEWNTSDIWVHAIDIRITYEQHTSSMQISNIQITCKLYKKH